VAAFGIYEVVYACALAATLLYYCHIRNRTLGEWLSPGAGSHTETPAMLGWQLEYELPSGVAHGHEAWAVSRGRS
jgi:hypothetical protein